MALATYAGLAAFDQSTAAHLDLSDELAAVLLADVFLLGRIPVRGVATNVDHYWVEDTLNSPTVTLNAAAAAGDTTLTVVSSAGLDEGALLIDDTLGSAEVIQVTNVVSSTSLTVVRAVGDSGPAAEAHANGALLRVIGSPKQEGDEQVNDVSNPRSRVHNVCQIFKKEVAISGTAQAINMAGVPDEFNHQIAMRLLEIRRELGQSVYGSVKVTAGGASGSDTVYRSMNGLRNFVRSQSSQLITTSQLLDETVVNALYRKIWDKGGMDTDFAVGHADQMTGFSEMYKDKVRLAPSERQRGVYVTKYLTDLGVELDLIIDRWALRQDLILGETKRLNLVPLQGRAMQSLPLAKAGDSMRGMIVGEYTLEVRNAGQAFSMHSNLSARP